MGRDHTTKPNQSARHYRSWTVAEERRMLDLLSEGLPVPEVARILGRSPGSISDRAIRCAKGIQYIRDRSISVRSATAVAKLLGVQRRVIRRWIAARVLTVRRNYSHAEGRGPRHYLITDTALMRAIANPLTWRDWSISHIIDPDWREFAETIRYTSSEDRLIPIRDVAPRLNYAARTIRGWIHRGLLPGVRVGSNLYIRESDLLVFVPPLERKHGR